MVGGHGGPDIEAAYMHDGGRGSCGLGKWWSFSQLLESAFDNVVTRLMTIDMPLERILSSHTR